MSFFAHCNVKYLHEPCRNDIIKLVDAECLYTQKVMSIKRTFALKREIMACSSGAHILSVPAQTACSSAHTSCDYWVCLGLQRMNSPTI